MLLPSAFPFDTLHQPQRSAVTSHSTPSSPGGFLSLSSCRTLQAILGSRPASPFQLRLSTTAQQKNEKPNTTSGGPEQPPCAPLQPLERNTESPQGPRARSQVKTSVVEPPRKSNKRTRADFESTDESHLVSSNSSSSSKTDPDYFSYPHHTSSSKDTNTSAHPQDIDTFSTPKRQCRIPLMMPFGLSAEDFEDLDAAITTTTATTSSSSRGPCPQTPPSTTDLTMPSTTDRLSSDDDRQWTPLDDRLLVSTVLDKLNLSHQDWNECAEKHGDSLGKRWRVLVGDGEVGLRRGCGGRSRPELLGRLLGREEHWGEQRENGGVGDRIEML